MKMRSDCCNAEIKEIETEMPGLKTPTCTECGNVCNVVVGK